MERERNMDGKLVSQRELKKERYLQNDEFTIDIGQDYSVILQF